VLGFRFGNVAYCTDVNFIPPESMDELHGLDVLIVDCLRREPHATHFGLAQALKVIDDLQPKRALLTHMSQQLEHEATNAELPAGVELAYDGMEIDLT
jgi:phosphoribosyl 1,2-cyclic phosphate phosphodiesterase